MRTSLVGEYKPFRLYVGITKQNVLFVWPIRIPGDDGRNNDYWITGHEFAELAKIRWIRVVTNMSLGAYEKRMRKDWDDVMPEWPDPMPNMLQILKIAFKDKIIRNMEHPLVKKLLG